MAFNPILPAVLVIKVVLAALGFSTVQMRGARPLELAGVDLGRWGQLQRRAWLVMAATGTSCRSHQSCLHGSQEEVLAH